MHFSSASVAYLETSYIPFNDCLQHCKLSILLAEVGGFLGSRSRSACSLPHGSRTPARGGYPRLIDLTVYGIVPFFPVSTI